MTEGLFDRYFRLLAGQLPAAEYGVIAEPAGEDATTETGAEAPAPRCLC
jgi:hypothetical protein